MQYITEAGSAAPLPLPRPPYRPPRRHPSGLFFSSVDQLTLAGQKRPIQYGRSHLKEKVWPPTTIRPRESQYKLDINEYGKSISRPRANKEEKLSWVARYVGAGIDRG